MYTKTWLAFGFCAISFSSFCQNMLYKAGEVKGDLYVISLPFDSLISSWESTLRSAGYPVKLKFVSIESTRDKVVENDLHYYL